MKLSHQANRKDFVLCNRPFCQNGADRASTENWGYKLYSSMAAQAAVMRAEVNNVQRKIASCAEKRLKNKKGRAKGDIYFLEMYLRDIKILMDDENCLVKDKCHRSMRKTEKLHSLQIVFESLGHTCSIVMLSHL